MIRLPSGFIFAMLAFIVRSGCAADREGEAAADTRLAINAALRQEVLLHSLD